MCNPLNSSNNHDTTAKAPHGAESGMSDASDPQTSNPNPNPNSNEQLLSAGGAVDPDRVRAIAAGMADGDNDDGALTAYFKLTKDLKKRLDQYLRDRIPFMSRTQLQRLIREKAVVVNDRTPKASLKLRLGDEIRVVVPPPPTKEIPAEDIPLDVLYEDDVMIVINKKPGIIVHPARSHKSGTIINALAYHFQHRTSGALSDVGVDQARPGVVHRLDKDTTGALIAAKQDVAHWRLGKQFQDRETDKRYLAIVHGQIEPIIDTVDLPIGKHPQFRELMAVRYDETAKSAVTIYRLREQYDGFALVELELKTGRTHQIRAHLAHLGWPIVGDDQYGGSLLNESDLIPNFDSDLELMHRQALHATTIAFRHPITDEAMKITAPVPDDIKRLIQLLRTFRGPAKTHQPAGATVDMQTLLPNANV